MTIHKDLEVKAREFPERLHSARRNGARAIGTTGRFIPEEMILACGAVPYPLCRGGEPEAPEAVLPYMLRFMSPFARAQIGYHLLEADPVIPELDLIAAQCDDCHMTRLADLIEYFDLPTARVGVPPDWDKPLSVDYYRRSLGKLGDRLAEVTGVEPTEDRLRTAVVRMNNLRDAFARIDHLRLRECPPLGGEDFLRLQHLSFLLEPEVAIEQLDRLRDELENRPSPFAANAPRILLAGHVVASGDYTVPSMIEEIGGVIVAEMLDEGHRFHRWKVDPDGDPMDSLVETYYRQRVPPTVFQPSWDERLDQLDRLIEECRVDAVIWYQLSFEEIYNLEYSVVAKELGARSVPLLKLESSYEYSRDAMGSLETRIESFLVSVSASSRSLKILE